METKDSGLQQRILLLYNTCMCKMFILFQCHSLSPHYIRIGENGISRLEGRVKPVQSWSPSGLVTRDQPSILFTAERKKVSDEDHGRRYLLRLKPRRSWPPGVWRTVKGRAGQAQLPWLHLKVSTHDTRGKETDEHGLLKSPREDRVCKELCC